MVQTSIFDLSRFYGLDPVLQQDIKDAILVQYEEIFDAPVLEHFVAQYFQLPKRIRGKINTVTERVFSENRLPLCYERFSDFDRTDYGVAQIKKTPHLFSERFVAYETGEELGVRGSLRFKIDCSSNITAKQLQDEMNRAFSAKTVKQNSTSKVLKINFGTQKQVTAAQMELLRDMLDTCKAELLVDLCGSDAIRLKNPWNAVMVMRREISTGRTILQGDKTVIQNFNKKINVFF